mgnify:CR=1 FL=1
MSSIEKGGLSRQMTNENQPLNDSLNLLHQDLAVGGTDDDSSRNDSKFLFKSNSKF